MYMCVCVCMYVCVCLVRCVCAHACVRVCEFGFECFDCLLNIFVRVRVSVCECV